MARTINWYVDNQIYQTTTCESGNDVTPPTPPAKHGYTFRWWYDTSSIEGTWEQSGTPTPDTPIYPVFYQNGNLVLRAVGTGTGLVADSYNPTTGVVLRRIGITVLDGTEPVNWAPGISKYPGYRFPRNISFFPSGIPANAPWLCSHFRTANTDSYAYPNQATRFKGDTVQIMFGISEELLGITSEASDDYDVSPAWRTWLAQQYANGTPVTVYYPLATPVTEQYVPNN